MHEILGTVPVHNKHSRNVSCKTVGPQGWGAALVTKVEKASERK